MMKKVSYKELEKVSGGTNWFGVAGACASGAIDSLTGGFAGMGKGCVKGAALEVAKQRVHKRHKHR